jgi:DNA-binding MarR family transcriptional regulator
MSIGSLSERERRVFGVLAGTCEHTGGIADLARLAPSTARSILYRLETYGLVKGMKHDERRIMEGGRIRIYWNLTEAAEEQRVGTDHE